MNFDLLDVKNLIDTFDRNEPTGDPFLDGRWQWHLDTFGNVGAYYRLFYRLSELLKPNLVVELGAWRCTGAAAWAPHANTVATIDHHSDPGDDVNEAWCNEAAQHYANLFYFKGWTWDVVHEVRDLGKPIDVLFIDSWHMYDKAMQDWNAYKPLLNPAGALLIFDDIFYGEGPAISRTGQAFEEMAAGHEWFIASGLATYPMGFCKVMK